MRPTAFSLTTLQSAEFPGKETYDHFENTEEVGCFACNSRMMLVRPIEVTDEFVLMVATTRIGDRFVVIPDCWLLYPKKHVTTLLDLPDNWTSCVKKAVGILGLQQPYASSENWGREAGQTVPHAHTWIIGRGRNESGLITENTGLATILLRVMMNNITMP